MTLRAGAWGFIWAGMFASILLLLGACRQGKPTPVAVTPTKVVTPVADSVPLPPSVSEVDSAAPETTPNGAAEPVVEPPSPPAFGTERIVLFVPGNPLII